MIHRLLILLVSMAGLNPAQDLSDFRRRAQTAVSEKRFNDALTMYRTLLGADPGDVDYILWIARLSAWSSDYTVAADLYSQVLALDPKNVDAMVGKANVLMWRHSYSGALALLNSAHELAPSNADVELAWAQYYHEQGDDKGAKLHLEKCLASDGENPDALELKERLVPEHTMELRIAYEGDTLPGTTAGEIEDFGATYFNREGDIGLDVFHMNRFGQGGSRGGLHFSRKLDDLTSLQGAFLFGGGGDIVPKQDLTLGMSRTVMHGLVLGADYRHIAFRSLKVDAAIGNLDYYFEKPIWIVTNLAANMVEGATTPALLIRLYSQVRQNLTMNMGYGHGTEIFQLALPTDLGAFRRDSYIGGITWALTKKTRVEATYTLARRSTGEFENMCVLALVHKL